MATKLLPLLVAWQCALAGCVSQSSRSDADAKVEVVGTDPLDASVVADRPHCFRWMASTIVGPFSTESLVAKGLGRAGNGWFQLALSGSQRLVGYMPGIRSLENSEGQATEGLELLLPRSQGKVLLSESGGGIDCPVQSTNRALGGSFEARRIDARVGWQFSVQNSEGLSVLDF